MWGNMSISGTSKHTFVICAYRESEHLEACIRSLLKQTVPPTVKMVTSTPNEHITGLAKKYDIDLFVREGKSDICADWNFAYDAAETEWMTVAHQDDIYDERYLEVFLDTIKKYPEAIAYTCDYIPIKNGQIGPRDINSKLRRLLRSPIKNPRRASSRFWKRNILRFGNSVCCPCVAYHKSVLGPSFFTSDLKFDIDWDTFYKIAGMDGMFAYRDEPLTYYRVYDGATTKEWIVNHTREREDIYMFRKFWPGWFANFLVIFYKKAYKTYD